MSIPFGLVIFVCWLRSGLGLDVLVGLELLEGMTREGDMRSVVHVEILSCGLRVLTLSLCCQNRVDVETVSHLTLHVVHTCDRPLRRIVVCEVRLLGVDQDVAVAAELIVTSTTP